MNKHITWAWAIKNSIDVICWVGMAVYFDKWWIALFAALFVCGLKTNTKTYRICDGCGKHSPYADDQNAAIDAARDSGWIMRKNGAKWEDFCPECQAKGLPEVDV